MYTPRKIAHSTVYPHTARLLAEMIIYNGVSYFFLGYLLPLKEISEAKIPCPQDGPLSGTVLVLFFKEVLFSTIKKKAENGTSFYYFGSTEEVL